VKTAVATIATGRCSHNTRCQESLIEQGDIQIVSMSLTTASKHAPLFRASVQRVRHYNLLPHTNQLPDVLQAKYYIISASEDSKLKVTLLSSTPPSPISIEALESKKFPRKRVKQVSKAHL